MANLKRIEKELKDFEKAPLPGCEAGPLDESEITKWVGTIPGPKETPYEGGTFEWEAEYPADYPFKPLKFTMVTKVYHPNVNGNGSVCMSILKDEWESKYTIKDVLMRVISLLECPDPTHPLEAAIAKEFTDNKPQFEATAKEWTKKYASG